MISPLFFILKILLKSLSIFDVCLVILINY